MDKYSIYDITKDFIFPFLLALVSALVAWFVFFKQIVEERKKEKKLKSVELKNKLTYLAMIVYNAVDNAKGQTAFIKQMIEEMDVNGIHSSVLSKFPLYDLKIIAEKLDIESYLLSYLEFYNEKKKIDVLSEFKKIIDDCGMINDLFTQVHNDLNSKHAFNMKFHENFYIQLEECANLFGECLQDFKERNDPLFPELWKINQLLHNADNIKSAQVLLQQHNLFVKPLLNFLDSCHEKRVEFGPDMGNLWVACSKASNTFENLKSETLYHKSRLIEDYNFLQELIKDLEVANRNLKEDFLT